MKYLLLGTMIIFLILSFHIVLGEESLITEPKIILKVSDMEGLPGDGIGYKITNIGDLDNNGVEDLATIAYHSANYTKDNDLDSSNRYGAIIILFMDEQGGVLNSKRITIDNDVNGLGTSCLEDPTREEMDDNILARDAQSLESLTYLGNFLNDNPTIAIGYPTGDFKGDDSNSGNVLLVEISTNGNVESCTKLTQLSGYSNDGSLKTELSFGLPLLTTDIDADGILDLIVGNAGHSMFADDYGLTDLLVFLLDDDGKIKDTNSISGMFLGLTLYDEGLESGTTLNGETKIVVGLGDEKGGDDGFIFVDMFSDGSLYSSNRIDEYTINYFGFDIDIQQNNPNYGNDFFDPDDDSDGTSDAFGNALVGIGDLNGDEMDDLIVGSFNDDFPVNDAGSIYFLLLNSTSDLIEEVFKLSNPNITSDDSFGHGITSFSSEDSKWLVVGAYLDDTEGTDSGVIYIYDFEDFSFYDSKLDNNPQPEENLKLPDPPKLVNPINKEAPGISTSDKVAKIWLRDPEKFSDGINYLIVTGSLHGDEIKSYAEFPDWIINYLYDKWNKEEITDNTFYDALQYLLDMQIIR